jgi:two-component system, NarL family, response regulator DevR
MAEISIVTVDDHAIVRQGLRALLDRELGMKVVGEAGSAEDALPMIARLRPEVVLLDLRLSAGSDSDGLSLCGQISAQFPRTRILVLTSFRDEWLVLEAIKQGAKGYVVKDVDLGELTRAIRAVRRGESAFDSYSASVVVRWLRAKQDPGDRSRQITAREREILALLAGGMSNVTIGQRLYISEATVKFHVGNILRKLGATRRAEAVYAASKLGII